MEVWRFQRHNWNSAKVYCSGFHVKVMNKHASIELASKGHGGWEFGRKSRRQSRLALRVPSTSPTSGFRDAGGDAPQNGKSGRGSLKHTNKCFDFWLQSVKLRSRDMFW